MATYIVIGDLLSLSLSPMYAVYYIVNAKNVKLLPWMFVYAIANFMMLIFFIPLVLIYLDFDYDLFFSRDEKYGAFGWNTDRYRVLSIF